MIEKDNNTLKAYTGPLSRTLREEYTIGEEYYRGDVKRGLRNSDGTGVLVGVSKVGSVQGYLIQDGQRIPAPGRLYYRGIDLYDIVGAHREAGTFEVKEVDVRQYVVWKDGYFTFENESLEQILNTLSLWYDIDVFFQSESAKQLVFTGYMKRYNDISEILNAITDVVGVNFTINGKTIIVSK